jgi:hypothetical protein
VRRILFRLRSHSLRSLPPSKVFYPVDEIPEEALKYVAQYFSAKCQYIDSVVPMFPPGDCIFLRRVKGRPEPQHKGDASEGVKAGRRVRADRRRWEAVWIDGEQIIEEGILMSRNQMVDHFSQRVSYVFLLLNS